MYGCDAATLAQFIHDAGIPHGQTSISYVFDCPRCNGRKKLYLRKRDGRFVCWVCKETDNYQGRPEYALADLVGLPVKVVAAKLYGRSGAPVELYLDVQIADFYGDGDEVDEEASEIPTTFMPLDYYPIDEPKAARGAAYLEGRGIPVDVAKRYNIHYAPAERRVIFPVESHGKLYGWQGRLVIPDHYVNEDGDEVKLVKIKGNKELPRERVVMFADRLVDCEHALVGEGPVDAIKADLVGGNVATMGKAVSREQMLLLLRSGVKRIYLALDPDAAEETQRLVRDYFDEVELYNVLARGVGKADLGAMKFVEVADLVRGSDRIRPGQIFVYFNPKVFG
jgi:hypothetical protein